MKKNILEIYLLSTLIFLVSGGAFAQDNKTLSTSGFVEVDYYSDQNTIIKTCAGKKAGFAQNYVSIGVNKLTVNKNDPLLKRIFNKDRYAFGVSNLKADYQSQSISISKVGNPIAIKGKDGSIDMGLEWGMLERIPWVLKNASFEIKLGYSAKSTTNSMIEAFSGVTAAFPDYTISTSLATGFAVTSAIDKLLFESDRAIDLLNAHRELPLFAGRLCEGHYAIFSAENNEAYEKYYKGEVVWTGNDLEFKRKPINDVSYAVISVRVSDKYYNTVESSLNDDSRSWASKYRDVQDSFFEFFWVSDKEQLNELTRRIRDGLLEARTLLSSDPNLLQKEKHDIHQYVRNDYKEKLKIASSRLDDNGKVTSSSTEDALIKALNNPNISFSHENTTMAERLLLNPEANLPELEYGFHKAFESAIKGTKKVLSIE